MSNTDAKKMVETGAEKMMSVEELKMGCFQILQAVNKNEACTERPCEIKESTAKNGGEGLFATRDIEKGEYITTYPVCWIVVTEGDKRSYACAEKVYGEDYRDKVIENYLDETCGGYSVGLFEDFTILGDPTIRKDNRLYGHMINDLSLTEEGYDDTKRNVAFSFLDIHAIKDIKEGDELSICYGKDFWDIPLNDGLTRRDMIKKEM